MKVSKFALWEAEGVVTVGSVVNCNVVKVDLLDQGAKGSLGVAEEVFLDSSLSNVLEECFVADDYTVGLVNGDDADGFAETCSLGAEFSG